METTKEIRNNKEEQAKQRKGKDNLSKNRKRKRTDK